MKTILRILILVTCFPALIACRSTNGLTLNINESAPIWIPPHVKKVGIIGRIHPSDQTRAMDKVDQVLSLEGTRLDQEGAKESIRGLAADLEKNNQFISVKQLDKPELTGPGMDVFPAPLAWETISQICQENQLDALFVLEFFDTNSKINYSVTPVTINGPLGVKLPAAEHQATMLTSIKTGWRIYDPQNKVIIDQHPMSQQMTSVGKGINPLAAATALLERKEAVKQTSYQIGQEYANNLQPYQIRVWREYYVRGTDSFKVGKRRAQTGAWTGAAELWERETQHPKRKVAGRACYNMAISSEINGNLDQAIVWAGRAYTDYNNRLALRYLNILKQRKAHVQEIERRQAADNQQ